MVRSQNIKFFLTFTVFSFLSSPLIAVKNLSIDEGYKFKTRFTSTVFNPKTEEECLRSINSFQQEAKKGNKKSQYSLVELYETSCKNDKKAVKWLTQLSFDPNEPNIYTILGQIKYALHQNWGEGIESNPLEANNMLKLAINNLENTTKYPQNHPGHAFEREAILNHMRCALAQPIDDPKNSKVFYHLRHATQELEDIYNLLPGAWL